MKVDLELAEPPARAVSGAPIFELIGIRHQFRRSPKEAAFTAIKHVDLRAGAGEFVSIVGPSGCGKSTLLEILAGLQKPTSGEARVYGEKVTFVRSDIGFIFQRDATLPWKTARQNVELPLKYRGVPRAEASERAMNWLKRIGLAKFADYYPHQLSGGMRKRVAIATTLVYEPALLLMDEPFSSLDVQTRDLIENDVMDLWQQSRRQTIVFVTHDLDEAIGMSDRIIVMTASPGRIRGEYAVPLLRPRNLLEVKSEPQFSEIHHAIWSDLRDEVLKSARAEAS